MKLSDLFGKIVLSDEGKRGYVLGINIFEGRLAYLRCADEEEREFVIETGDILSIGKEIVFRDFKTIKKKSTPLSLGKACYDLYGRYLGYLKEVEFKNDRLFRLKIGSRNYAADTVTIGDAIIIDERKKLKDSVVSKGKIIFSEGQEINDDILSIAKDSGEYVQTKLKSL